MVRVALALPIELEDRLAGELMRHGHDVVARCSSADELASVLRGATAAVAIVAASPRYLNRRLLTESDAAGVRIVAMAAGDDERRNAATLDLREVVAASAAWPEIEEMMLGAGPAAGADGAQRRGQVVAIWGPAGSPGRTTLAIALAAEIAAEGHTVALADVDTHSGSVAPALGLLDEAPGFAAACRLAGADSLTQRELERIGQRYLSPRGSFWVLTGIGRPSRWPELSAERVVGTIGACREWVDFTIVDTGSSLENDEEISSDLFAPRRNAATIAALREADQVVAIGSADPVGLSRFLRAHVDLVETIETDRVAVVMNKIRASAIGPGASSQVRQTLQRFGGISDLALVPYDRAALDAAVLSGRTLCDVAPKSAARVAIRQLTRERVLPTPEPARRRFGRRVDRRGQAAG
ncbi:AAA family ATPase [Lacisediminihabitans profunda]|uniref:Regulator n=1 Tax=Lacisediminihabitans profunda TaxID=2594790 RepID=A0A5C8UMZ5_9MICO|nr:regulator [Lacisediminihabitans profunda]TXN28769.1 regulator [Lacisediminihabitans profunda]